MRIAARSSRFSKPNNAFSTVVLLLVIVTLVLLVTSRTSQDSKNSLLSHQDNTEGQQRQQFQLATHESMGFFYDIPDEDWLLYKRRAREESWFTARAESQRNAPLPNSNEIQLWLLENVDPFFTCPHMRRVGGNGDGHKWVCDPHRLGTAPDMVEDCLVYSVGCNGDYSFEDDLVRVVGGRRCEIHVFDMEPKYERPGDVEKNNIHYHAWGLKAYGQVMPGEGAGKEYYSLQEIMKKLGHSNRRLDVLKVDCGGCEFAASKDWLRSDTDVHQILMEFHAPRQPQADFYAFFNAFRDRGFALFSKEANTHPLTNAASGQYFEFSFVRLHKDFFTKN